MTRDHKMLHDIYGKAHDRNHKSFKYFYFIILERIRFVRSASRTTPFTTLNISFLKLHQAGNL